MPAPAALPPRSRLRARLLIDGAWVEGPDAPFAVLDKYTGEVIGHADRASQAQVDAAVAAAHRSFLATPLDATAALRPAAARRDLIERRRDELARADHRRGRLPGHRRAATRSTRAVQTFLIVGRRGQAAGRRSGADRGGARATRTAWRFTIRVPRGVVCGITSFNAPLNFVAHKVAPALASGNTVVHQGAAGDAVQRRHPVRDPARGRLPAGARQPGAGAGQRDRRAGWSSNPRSASTPSPAAPRSARRCSAPSGCGRSRSSWAASRATIVCDDADLDRAAPRVRRTRRSAAPGRPAPRRSGCSCSARWSSAFVEKLAAADRRR